MENQFTQVCPRCGVEKQTDPNTGQTLFHTAFSKRPDNDCKPFTPAVMNSRVCGYTDKQGCINTSAEIIPSETLEGRAPKTEINHLKLAKEIMQQPIKD